MASGRPRAAALLALALLQASPPRALAQPAPASDPKPMGEPARVEVFVAAPSDAAVRLERSVVLPEATLTWVAVASPIDPADVLAMPRGAPVGSVGAVWIDAGLPDRVRLYFANLAYDRFLTRDVKLSAGLDEAGVETLAQVIESSLDSLLSDNEAGMTRAEMTAAVVTTPRAVSVTPQPARPSSPATWWSSATIFYAGKELGGPAPVVHGPGLDGELMLGARGWGGGAWASFQYAWPSVIEGPWAGVELQAVASRAGVAIARELAQVLSIEARAGAGFDFVSVTPRAGLSGSSVELSPAASQIEYVLSAGVVLRLRLSRQLGVALALLVDTDVDRVHYDVLLYGARTPVFTPWQTKPGVFLGFAFGTGPERF
jgi:hypothetical protein